MAYSSKTTWKTNDIVKPEDLNRIEKGIADAHRDKADATMSNVTSANFATKAKESNISVFPTAGVKLYVSSTGSDTAGNGSSSAPFRTIQKALNTFEDSNNLNVAYTLEIAGGDYLGFTINSSKSITAYVTGQVVIAGDIKINSGNLRIVTTTSSDTSFVISDGSVSMQGGNFYCSVYMGVTRPTLTTAAAIECSRGAQFNVQNELIIANHTIGINCSNSRATIRRILTDVISTGIICDNGIVQLGDEVIQASVAKYVTQYGGRIFVGAQTNIPNY